MSSFLNSRASTASTEAETVEPDSIEETFVPRRSEKVVSASLGSEMVLVDVDTGMVHALNPTASLVWQCFDGESPLDVIADDLAEVFEAPADLIRGDVVSIARAAGRAGLLDGVAAPGSGTPEIPGTVPVGESVSIPALRTPDRGAERQTLLINWSPACGFCLRILPVLATLQPALDRSATDVVLLDRGDPAATEGLLEEHGLIAQVVRSATSVAPGGEIFADKGTPIAYLLDAERRVASPLAYGAEDVVSLARAATGEEPEYAGEGRGQPDEPRFLPVGSGVCGGGGGQAGPPSAWEATGVYSVAGYQIGIRAASPMAEEILSKALGTYRLPADAVAPDNFSVVLGEAGSGGRRQLSLLLKGSTVVTRSRSPRRVVHALAGHLSCLFEPDPGLLRLDSTAVVFDGSAALVPRELTDSLERVQPTLARLGMALLDEPFAHVAPATRELVVAEPRVRLDGHTMQQLPDPVPGASEPSSVPVGRYPLRAWLLPSNVGEEVELSPARALAAALGTLVAEPSELAGSIDVFIGLLEGLETVAIPCRDTSALLNALCDWRGAI